MKHHVLIHIKTTYFNIGYVDRLGFTTSSQALKRRLLALQHCLLTPLCGVLEFFTSHKEQNQIQYSNITTTPPQPKPIKTP